MAVALITLCAQITIPLQPVPITLQTLAIALIALTYKPRETFYSLGLYVGLGVLGLPLFSHFQGGIHVLLSPRGGYLIGFILGGTAMSWLAAHPIFKNTYGSIAFSCLWGTVLLYFCGVLGLGIFMNFSLAFQVGVIPFILPGIAKSLLLAGALGYIKSK